MTDKSRPGTARRKAALNEFRRKLIRDAAQRVFVSVGLPGASVREIARAAGCTTGAIYAQYASKEEVYADILRESLSEMAEAVEAGAKGAQRGRQGQAALRAWFEYFRDRPSEYDLGFYLYGGTRPTGVGKELNRELNVRLKQVYAIVADAMETDGLATPEDKHETAVAGASWIFGILLMLRTGRLKILSIDAERLVNECLSFFSTSKRKPPDRRKLS